MREQRGDAHFICFEEGSPRTLDPSLPFMKHLPVVSESLGGASKGVQPAEKGGDDAEVKGFKKSIFELQLDPAKPGEIGIVPVKSGKLPRELLKSDSVFVVDSGFHAYLWVGGSAAFPMRISAFVFAQAYLKRYQRPVVLPLTRFGEGQESDKFLFLFAKPVGYRIDAKPEPKRLHPLMRKPPAAAAATPQAAYAPVLADNLPKKPAAQPVMAAKAKAPAADAAAPKVDVAAELMAAKAKVPAAEAAAPKVDVAAELDLAALTEVRTEAPPGYEAPPADDEEDEGPPPPRWQDVPTAEKIKCHNGTCFPVVSDAWGCCLTSCGCSWADRVACLGVDIKGLYSPCVQIEAICLKPSFDEANPDVYCVLFQGYGYGVIPEPKVCKGSQQAFCIQNRCSLPCDDEVPSTCTLCGYQRCQQTKTTGETLELVPFLPYPEVRIMGEAATKRGGDADDFNLHWACKACVDTGAQAFNTKSFFNLNSCCGFAQTVGCDFPSCIGANLLGTCLCCLHVDMVVCKPVERHPRVECMLCQGGAYIAKPKPNSACGYSLCKGTGSACCLEHRYAFPPENMENAVPARFALCGAQCCRFVEIDEKTGQEAFTPQCECERTCGVKVVPLPRVKPAVAEASDVLYHDTRGVLQTQLKANVPQPSEMQRL